MSQYCFISRHQNSRKLNIQWETTAAVSEIHVLLQNGLLRALFAFCLCAICIVSGFSRRIEFSRETWAIKLLWEFKGSYSCSKFSQLRLENFWDQFSIAAKNNKKKKCLTTLKPFSLLRFDLGKMFYTCNWNL